MWRELVDVTVEEALDNAVSYQEFLTLCRSHFVERAIEREGGIKTRAAERIGIHRNSIDRHSEKTEQRVRVA
jgi:transcriptional regulator with PAS, ATPase and Fis domain